MEQMLQDMMESYVIQDPIAISNARMICKMTMKMNKYVDIDDVASEEIPDNNLCHADPQLLVKTLIKLSKSKDFNLSSNNDSSGFLIATTFHNDIKTWEIPKQRYG